MRDSDTHFPKESKDVLEATATRVGEVATKQVSAGHKERSTKTHSKQTRALGD